MVTSILIVWMVVFAVAIIPLFMGMHHDVHHSDLMAGEE